MEGKRLPNAKVTDILPTNFKPMDYVCMYLRLHPQAFMIPDDFPPPIFMESALDPEFISLLLQGTLH